MTMMMTLTVLSEKAGWSYVHGEFHVSDHSGSDHSELELDFFFEYYLCTSARVHILESKTLEF